MPTTVRIGVFAQTILSARAGSWHRGAAKNRVPNDSIDYRRGVGVYPDTSVRTPRHQQ